MLIGSYLLGPILLLLGINCINFGYILESKKSFCLTETLSRNEILYFNVTSLSPEYIFKVEVLIRIAILL